MRDWQKNLVLCTASLAATLLVAECVLRVVWQPGGQQTVIRADPLYGWALRAGSGMHSVNSDRGLHYDIHVSALGLRDRGHSRSKPAGHRRVLFLGDSIVFGAGVQEGERCSDILEASLGPDVEVVNAGVSGWGTDQEFLYLCHEGLDLQPDFAVLGLCVLNDVLNNMLPHELFGTAPKPRFVVQEGRLVLQPAAPRPSPPLRQRGAALLKHSRLLRFVGRHARMLRTHFEAPPAPATPAPYYPENLDTDASHWSVYRVPYTPRFEAAFEVTEALLTAMRDSCAAHGVPLLIFAFPQKVEVDPQARARELAYYGYDPAQFDLTVPYARLRRLAASLGVPFLYPLESFQQEETRTPLFFTHDGHPNAAGHAAAARALEPALRAMLRDTAALHHASRG